MIRNLKILGLTLVTVFAMSGVAASAASANAPYWFNSDGDWTALWGSQGVVPDVLTVDGGTVQCNSTPYSGSTSATTTTTIKLAPAPSACSFKPLPGLTMIHMNGCEYEFHADTNTENGQFDTETTIVCPFGGDITITVVLGGVTKCTVHIGEQNLGTGIVLTNDGSGDLRAHISFSNIKYTQTAGIGEGKCATTITTFNGTWSGSATIRGKNTSGAVTSIAVL